MSFVDDFFGTRDDVRALVVAPYQRVGLAHYRFDEFISLCEAAELEPVGVETAAVREIHPGTYFRAGQIERFQGYIDETGADLLAVDVDLSPVQQRQLEKAVGVGVLDRSAIILTIFGRRAQSKAGKLQVALAQNEYILPRLVGLWGHFDREKGGIGMRGAGEKQIEIDRRLIQQRIAKLKKDLKKIERTQSLHRSKRKRSKLLHVAIVGYTNVGKSTLLRELSQRSVFVRNMPFATLDTLTRRIELPDGITFLLTDTVGFVQDLPHALVAAFTSTLEEAIEADVRIHMIDASAPEPQTQIEVTAEVMQHLGAEDEPTLYVLNKMDMARGELPASMTELSPSVETSIVHGQGIDVILDWIKHQIAQRTRCHTVTVPIDRPDLIQLAEQRALRPGRWSDVQVEYDIPDDQDLIRRLAG